MTEEEENAIERLDKSINSIAFAILYSQEEKDKDIEIALNLIQKQKTYIEDASDITTDMSNTIKKLVTQNENYKKTLADVHAQYLNNSIAKEKEHEKQLKMLNEGWKIELEKKDKIINEMAIKIHTLDDGYIKYCNNRSNGDCEILHCKDCIKQYYEKKVGGNDYEK